RAKHGQYVALYLVLVLAFGSHVFPAYAQDAAPPVRELKQTRAQIDASKQRQAALKKNLEEMESGLNGLQKETGTIAKALKKNQQLAHDSELQLMELEREATAKQTVITRRRKDVAALLATVLRISQVPPYAVFAMQDGLESQIHASRALGLTTRSIKKETDRLSVQLRQMAALRAEIAREQQALNLKQQRLELQRASLEDHVTDRRRMMETLHTEELQEQQRISQLTRQSKDLESLVTSLEAARDSQLSEQYNAIGLPQLKPAPPTNLQKNAASDAASDVVAPPAVQSAPRRRQEYDLARAKGALALPVAGTLSGRYGQQQASNDTLKGLLLSTPSQAVVTTPYGGEVMFTGPFRDYGQMVIIRHSHRFHTLLAGLSRIDVAAGQFLLEGEPIGAMGDEQEDRRLYVELRENGKAVDPAPWFGGVPRLARN
ncbi:MAG: peptidoglycan DD-metalloendopeptidase family protein, partial [Rickettsiales bacterium]|nr:peptidoglycan DD-metalloendopeptidase family protein [Rickettsiales bacterium]